MVSLRPRSFIPPAIVSLAALGAGAVWAEPLRLPAHTAYLHPNPEAGASRQRDGRLTEWHPGTEIIWYGRLAVPGELTLSVELAGKGNPVNQWRLTVTPRAGATKAIELTWPGTEPADDHRLPAQAAAIAEPGYYSFALTADPKPGGALPDLAALVLDGPAAKGAQISTVERRNAASVHLAYPPPAGAADEIEWFYLEATPKTDPLWTYYEATGWHRGYFGMQVNSPTERRIIFSVWDSGREAANRENVAADDRVVLLARGPGVVANDFGNEGTGGHSHLVYPWKLGGTFRFLMRGRPDEARTHTTYSGWFFDPATSAWRLIARFRAPKDGRYLHGLYSFNEDFGGATGDQRRRCEFGSGWLRTAGGRWLPLTTASFSHDSHGKSDRLDRAAGVVGGRFFLANGGFIDEPTPGAVTRFGDIMTLPAPAGTPPTDADLAALPDA